MGQSCCQALTKRCVAGCSLPHWVHVVIIATEEEAGAKRIDSGTIESARLGTW
jgi:hypothetical protein